MAVRQSWVAGAIAELEALNQVISSNGKIAFGGATGSNGGNEMAPPHFCARRGCPTLSGSTPAVCGANNLPRLRQGQDTPGSGIFQTIAGTPNRCLKHKQQ
jgi:hypothetical protein